MPDPPSEPVLIAESLAARNAFADPYKVPTGPTAHTGPAFPFLVSLVYRVFGSDERGAFVRDLLCRTVSSLQYALLPVAAAALGLPLWAGVAAGLAGAFLPLKAMTEIQGYWEAPYTALLLMLLSAWSYREWRRAEFRVPAGLWLGLWWGVAFLFSPALAPIFAGLLAAGLLWAPARSRYLRHSAAAAAMALLMTAPWMARNYVRLGTLSVRDNFGLELFTSYHPGATVRVSGNFLPEPHGVHPSVSTRECERIREIGEVPYNREKLHAALGWIAANRAEAARLAGLRFLFFWLPWTGQPWRDLLVWLITVAGVFGLARLWRRKRLAASLFLAIWLAYPPLYYIIEASTRYRYPIDWMFLMMAGYLVTEVAGGRPRTISQERELVSFATRG